MKRSTWPAHPRNGYISDWYMEADLWYWCPNYAGYTHKVEEAGLYKLSELERAGGSLGDWLVEPVWKRDLDE